MRKKIYLIRHGKTKGNFEKRYIGKTDESLSSEGIIELKQKINRYPKADLVVTSPMKRCMETAELIYADQEKLQLPELRECDFGLFENKTYEELKDHPLYRDWLDSGGKGDIPQGESSENFKRRCKNAFESVLEEAQKREIASVAIVAHGGTFMAILEGYAPSQHDFYHWQIENGGIRALTIENKKIIQIERYRME